MALVTYYWGLDCILLLTFFTFLVYLYATRKFRYWVKRGVMELPPVPLFGNFADFVLKRKNAGAFIKDLYNQAKDLPYMGFYMLDIPVFLPRDPELIKSILVKDFVYFQNRYASAEEEDRLGSTNLFLVKNPTWKILRGKLNPIYSSGKVKQMFGLMLEVGHDLDTYLNSIAGNGLNHSVEVKDLCGKFTTDLISTTAFGFKVNSLNNPNAEFRKHGKKIFEYDNARRGLELLAIVFAPHLVKIIRAKTFVKESAHFLRSVFWEAINERLSSGGRRNDLIDLLIDLKKSHENGSGIPGFQFNGDDLVAQAAVFFSAGFETSSLLLSFMLYELSLNPEMQNKLREEILEGIQRAGGKITYDMIINSPYMDMVVSEGLRKYPPLPFVDRVANADYKIPNSDLVIEKGTPVIVPMIGLHHDPKYFPEPDRFDPERFSEENKKKIPSGVFFPFGDGPHVCIGMRIGYLQSKLGLVQILKDYEISPCEATPIPMRFEPRGITTTPLGGLYMNFRKLTTKHNEGS